MFSTLPFMAPLRVAQPIIIIYAVSTAIETWIHHGQTTLQHDSEKC